MPKITIEITPKEYNVLSETLQKLWTGRANPKMKERVLFQNVFEYVNQLVQEAFQKGKQIGAD